MLTSVNSVNNNDDDDDDNRHNNNNNNNNDNNNNNNNNINCNDNIPVAGSVDFYLICIF